MKGTCKTRLGRYSEPNRIYHLTTCTADRKPLFADFITGRTVVRALISTSQHSGAVTLAYVVMPDHLHWLLQLGSTSDLSATVRIMKSRSARRINAGRGTRERVWQSGFYDRALRREEDLVAIARYIVANPLRAGITDSLRRYSLWDAVWV